MQAWPADEVERRAVAELVPYARNARTHSEEQVAQIAASIREWGWTVPVLIDEQGGLIAGHGRVLAAVVLGIKEIPAMVARGWTDAQKRAYVLADNKLALNAGWDDELLRVELLELQGFDFDVTLVGFGEAELAKLMASEDVDGLTEPDALPDLPIDAVSRRGDVWRMGGHRVMCGDSTVAGDVAALMSGHIADLLHADPPYGMGKEADGVENDNLYAEKLDAFQMAWWRAFRPHVASNGSAYIWGTAPALWRLWYRGGLEASERFALRNEIVWDKKSIAGMKSDLLTQYPDASERALFFQFGDQFLSNINIADYPAKWEKVRAPLAAEAKAAGVGPADIRRVCGCAMYGHWFSQSQFTLIPAKHYRKLAEAFPGHFQRPWREIKRDWDQVRGSGRDVIAGKLQGMRAYFDNAHDVMRDVWDFPRVTGEERFEHATPKPVAMMERIMRSSLQAGGLCVEPFGGSGSTVIGAERTGRLCFAMELQPRYVDVAVIRWQQFTGQQAVHLDGRLFDDVRAQAGEKVAA